MKAFEIVQLIVEQERSKKLYLEFLRESSMSLGLYVLPVGGVDPQQPHTEDEVYYIVGGQGMIQVNGEDRSVQTGSIVFVPAHVPHHFHSITRELTILVFFAPAEYTNTSDQ